MVDPFRRCNLLSRKLYNHYHRQNVTGAATAKRYWTFNATAGCIYNFSTCNSVNTNDTYLRLYSGTNPLTAVLLVTADDNGPWCAGTKASFNWTCPTTGAYSILLTNYSCANLSASTILSYRLSFPETHTRRDTHTHRDTHTETHTQRHTLS